MSEHADPEALSAYVDGEAPEWAAHVAECAECQLSADRLRDVAAAVAAPVEPAPATRRDAALAAALGAADALGARPHGVEPAVPRPPADGVRSIAQPARAAPPAPAGHRARRSAPPRWLVPAVAAAVLVAAGFSALLAVGIRSSTSRTTLAGPALAPGPAADTAAPVAPLTDLGDVPDAATLLGRARPALAAKGASSGAASGGSAAAGAAATVAPSASGQRAAAPAPATVGTRPCEEVARARQPGLREVVYFATARSQGVPAVVLGFSTGPTPAPVTLLLLAQDGCAELLRAAGP